MGPHPYLRLARLPAAGFTASIPLWGYLAGLHGEGLDPDLGLSAPLVLGLVGAGAAAHVFGCVHNEVCDRELDALPAYGRPKPLPSGEASVARAKQLAGGALLAGLAAAAAVAASSGPWVLALCAASAGAAAAYNAYGKRFLGGELLYSLSLVLFLLTGAAAAGPSALGSPSVLAFSALACVLFSVNVVLAGGLKDIESDAQAGMRTLLGALYARGKRRGQPFGLIALLQGVPGMAVLALAGFSVARVFDRDPSTAGLRFAAVLVVVLARTVLFARAIGAADRRARVRLLALHELLMVAIFPVLLGDTLSAALAVALVLSPLAWYLAANALLYRTWSAPDV